MISAGVENRDSSNAKLMHVNELFKIEKGTLASDNSEDDEFDFITGAEEWKTHTEYKYEKEALVYVISAGGSLGRSHYVNGKFIASNLCIVLTPRNPKEYPLNLKFYNTYFNKLRKKIVSDLADVTSKLTIKETDFKKYYIDYIDIKTQNKFVEEHIDKFDKKISELKQTINISRVEIENGLNEIL